MTTNLLPQQVTRTLRAWSYSALTDFENCAKKYHATRVAKSYREEESEHMSYGKEVHKALELRVTKGKELPLGLKHMEKFGALVDRLPGKEIHCEVRIALDPQYQPVDFFANNVWVRGVADVIKINDTEAFCLDWKTGKRKPDFDQLALMAAIVFCQMPNLKKITAAFVWVKDAELDKEVYTRDHLHELWNRFLPRVERFQNAFDTTEFPARPSGLCKRYCPVSSCPYHGT